MARPSLEDRIAIEDLFTRYAWALDKGDVEGIIACFTDDAVLESPVLGRFAGAAAVREFAEKNARQNAAPGAIMRHVMTNIRADVEGDRATAQCYLINYLTRAGKTELLAPGEYDCRLERVAGAWRFSYRFVKLDQTVKI